MFKTIIKRGVMGVLISLSTVVIIGMCILLFVGDKSITFSIDLLEKNFISTLIVGFISFASSAIFTIEKWSLLKRTVIHFIILFVPFIHFAKYAGWIPNSHLFQAIFLSFYVIAYVFVWICIFMKNKKDVDEINKKLKQLNINCNEK